MERAMQVPFDGRPQVSGMMAMAMSLDRPGTRWQRVNQDAYVLAPPPVRRMAPASGEGGSPGTVGEERSEAPRSKAAVIWPHLRSVG
jgi:hypothetical protein